MAAPLDVLISGQALDSFGQVGVNNTQQGLGVITRGFLWPCDGIWALTFDKPTTNWVLFTYGSTGIESCGGYEGGTFIIGNPLD